MYWQPLRAFEKAGVASYNYAANTIQPELYKTMIKEILKTQKPKLIVIDARCFQYRDKDQPPQEVSYRNVLTGMPLSLNKIEFIHNNIKKYLGEDQSELSYYFDIIKYHRDLKNEKINDQLKMALNSYHFNDKGFQFQISAEKLSRKEYYTIDKTALSKDTEEILIDLLDYMKTTDCNYLFVVSPYVEYKEHKEVYNYVSDIVESYGYNFLDCNDFEKDMNLNFNTDFYNSTHTNIFGSEKYTDFLLDYMLENYELPDRKAEYKDWVDLLPEWDTLVMETEKATQILVNKENVKDQN